VGTPAAIEAAAAAGFAAVELRAAGVDEPLRRALEAEGVQLAAAPLELSPEASRGERRELEQARAEALDALAELGGGTDEVVVLLLDATADPERLAAAGEVEAHRRLWTTGARLARLVDELHRAAEACRDRGLVPAALPRPGTLLETPREVDALAHALDVDLVGLCLDVEGWRTAGGDPAAFVAEFAELTAHVRVGEDVAVLPALRAAGYAGWVSADVGDEAGALAAARERLAEAGLG
jgi:sugar phosphate isomerase/epimerase